MARETARNDRGTWTEQNQLIFVRALNKAKILMSGFHDDIRARLQIFHHTPVPGLPLGLDPWKENLRETGNADFEAKPGCT
jgi:hypothetical protein